MRGRAADQRDPPAADAESPTVAYVQPENAKDLSGMQTVEDKVDNLCQRIEARDSTDDDTMGWITYAAIIVGFFIGTLLSGPVNTATGGGGTPTPVGVVDLSPILEVVMFAL